MSKSKSYLYIILKAWGAWEEHKFTHVKYNKMGKKNNLLRNEITFILFGVLGVESPHGGAIMHPKIVGTWI
jgi:hypothetical protein